MEKVDLPSFVATQEAFDYVKSGKKPVVVMILGTIWSPQCRYTMKSLHELLMNQKYQAKIQEFYIDQDRELEFCFSEGIPVGFPTILVFVNSYLVPFVKEGSSFDPSKVDQKNRLISQCSKRMMKYILDNALEVLDGTKESIPFKESLYMATK